MFMVGSGDERKDHKAAQDRNRLREAENLTRQVDRELDARHEPRTAILDIPDIPNSLRGVWGVIESEVDEQDKLAALRLWCSGEGLQDAADAHRVHRKALWKLIQQYGLAKLRYTTESLMGLHKITAHLALETIVTRMLENPEEFKTKDLAVLAGISSDKLGSYEGWARSGARGGEDYASDLSKWGADLMKKVEPGGKVKLELTVEREPDAIDVTAVPVETG
jgi:hypothetical protein